MLGLIGRIGQNGRKRHEKLSNVYIMQEENYMKVSPDMAKDNA